MAETQTNKHSPKVKDLIGKAFGRLTVIGRGPNTKQFQTTWICQCTCGNLKTIAGSSLRHGLTTTCGCGAKDRAQVKVIDLVNQRFGHLVVMARADSTSKGRALWQCLCDCGTIKIIPGKELRNGHNTSCGCAKAERFGDFARTHGRWATPKEQSNNTRKKYRPTS